MTTEQYKHIYKAVKSYREKHAHDEHLYAELNELLNELKPLANPSYRYRYSD